MSLLQDSGRAQNSLKEVLNVLEEHHFFINASKCASMEKEIEYFGHFISVEGVKVDHRKIEVMIDSLLPKENKPDKENKLVNALSQKKGSSLLWIVHEEDEAESMALSGI